MKSFNGWSILSTVVIVAIVINCQKEIADLNHPPVANAGPDQQVILPKDSTSLNGNNSYDHDGKIIAFKWTKIGGGNCIIVHDTASRTMVRSLNVGVYQFELTITDNAFAISRDTMEITVLPSNEMNHPPVAVAGRDQTIFYPVNSCIVDGSSSYDPDGNIVSYQWNKIAGPDRYTITDKNSARTTVTSLLIGEYQFELVVKDNQGLTGRDTISISSYNMPCDPANRPQVTFQLTEIGTLSVPRVPAVAAAGSKIVFAGGPYKRAQESGWYYDVSTDAVDIYDVNTGSWSIAKLSQPRARIAAIGCGKKIFFAGGETANGIGIDNVDIYDVSTGLWSVAHLSQARTFISAATIGSKVFFAGGRPDLTGSMTARVDIYDIATDKWTTAELSERKVINSRFTKDNKLYFAAGFNNSTEFSRTIDIYDNNTGAWSRAEMPIGFDDLEGVTAGNTFLWLYYTFDIAANFPIQIRDDTGVIEKACLFSGTLWASRNSDLLFHYTGVKSVDLYNISSHQWSFARLQEPLHEASVVQLNNKIYLAGGRSDITFSNKVYLLDW
jgi:hypothetical protein